MAFLRSKKVLYFPGCLVSSVLPEIENNYERVFINLKLDVHKISQSICCGSIAHSNGYTKDFENLKERATEIFHGTSFKNIVTNSSNCLWTLSNQYGFKVEHVTQLLARFSEKLPVMYDEEVSFYDSPDLKIYEAPRKILEAVGFDLVELEKHKENTIISGAEGGMIQNIPLIANKLVNNIFDMCKTKKLIVTDPLSYYHLKNNAPRNIQVLELGEVLNR